MSGEQPTDEEILAALGASGFLMEQDVATKIEDAGFNVHTSRAFQDVDEGKSREIDVWAVRRFIFDEEKKFYAFSELIVECKNSNNPYIFITRRKGEADKHFDAPEIRFPIKRYEARKDIGGGRANLQFTNPFSDYGFKDIHPFFLKEQKAVQFCRVDRSGKSWSANHSGLYDAMFMPILKELKSRQAETAPKSIREEWRHAWFFYPIIVVRGRLLEIDGMSSKPTPTEVPFVPYVRHIKSKHIEGRYLVYFVNENYLSDFINQFVLPIEKKMESINLNDFLNPTREWRDAQN